MKIFVSFVCTFLFFLMTVFFFKSGTQIDPKVTLQTDKVTNYRKIGSTLPFKEVQREQ